MKKTCVVNRRNGEILSVGVENFTTDSNITDDYRKTIDGKDSILYQTLEKAGFQVEKINEIIAKTRTPEFKEWFGNSKVVDENGEPLVVFHGSQDSFSNFDSKIYNVEDESEKFVAFFAENIDYARKYQGIVLENETPNMYPVFLRIENPNYVLNEDMPILLDDKINWWKNYANNWEKSINTLSVEAAWDTSKDGFVGYDSGTKEKVWVITDPYQVKSVDNIGKFSKETDNIYLSKGDNNIDNTPKEILNSITDRLMSKGFVSKITLMSSEGIQDYLKELGISDSIMKSIKAFHGSPYLFKKFSLDFINKGEKAQVFGWGLYFTQIRDIAKHYAEIHGKGNKIFVDGIENEELTRYINDNYIKSLDKFKSNIEQEINNINMMMELPDLYPNTSELQNKLFNLNITLDLLNNSNVEIVKKQIYDTTLHEGKDPSEYTWLEWYKAIPNEIYEKIIKEAEKKGIDKRIGKIVKDAYTGQELYETLYLYDGIFKSDKEVSLFLLDAGIDGIKYPPNTITTGNTEDREDGLFNYVIFDENAVTIDNVVSFNKTGLKIVPGGLYNSETKEIIINREGDNVLNSLIHEFAHPTIQWLRDNKREHFDAGVEVLRNNSEEAKPYYDLIDELYPELQKNSDKYHEEVLAHIVGDNGERLVNSKKSSSIRRWLQDLWDMFKNMMGITAYTPQEVANMTLQQLAESINTEMFNDRALSLGVLESKDLSSLRGRMVSPITIKNILNKQGVKQIEKNLINSVLEQPEFQTKKINYNKFEFEIQRQLMPLEILESNSYSSYGSENLKQEYDSQVTNIFNSPLNHGVTGHFHSDYEDINEKEYPVQQFRRQRVIDGYELIHENTNQMIAKLPLNVSERYFQRIQDNYIKENNLNGYLNEGLFGHTRVWTDGDVYNLVEVQSDVFQKEDVSKLLRSENLDAKLDSSYSEHLGKYRFEIREISKKYEVSVSLLRPSEIDKNARIMLEGIKEKTTPDDYREVLKQYEEIKLEFENNVKNDAVRLENELTTKEEKQFKASEKNFELRLIRESIKDAAKKGFKTLRIPLPYTLSTIEGHINNISDELQIDPDSKIGDTVEYLGDSWIVVDTDPEGADIIKESEVAIEDVDDAIDDMADQLTINLLEEFTEKESRAYSFDEIESKIANKKNYFSFREMFEKEFEKIANSLDYNISDVKMDLNDYEENIKQVYRDNTSSSDLRDHYSEYYDYYTVFIANNKIYSSNGHKEFVSTEDTSVSEKEYHIEDLDSSYASVAKRYEYFGKIMEKERGQDNFRIVRDSENFPWYETDILESDYTNPVIAFNKIQVNQNEFIPSQLFEVLKQQPFITTEEALEAYKNIYTDEVGNWQNSEFNC